MSDPLTIREAVLNVPGVVAMHPGPYGTAWTFAAGQRITGLRVGTHRLDVHLVTGRRIDVREVAQTVQVAITDIAPQYTDQIFVHVEDLAEDPSAHDQSHHQLASATPRADAEPRRTT